ncbi:hypothetical protein [Pollutimonas sp. M17]|uniref:hypothetical protein n=1 Tax=Pollutimonas sp. M17 TaxID=2962065 RepID=UPI0021F493E2|nr:hypothetical protein [Pollutimonas sp. M17]UYO93134.1 hypothetical protein OEG81_14775 [Pollutimonas sp. M17]
MVTPTSGSSAASATTPPYSAASAAPLTDEARAGALWTFLQARAPRFTFDQALELVRSLHVDPREDHKTLAKRLRKELQERRIALKHVNALHAAARLNGHASWHTDDEPTVARLRFEVFDSGTQIQQFEFASWSELAVALRAWADKLYTRGELPLGVLTMNFTGRSLRFTVPVPKRGGSAGPGRNELWPVGGVTPVADDNPDWLTEAPAALEKLRRHLEETSKAVLDGYATLYLCANSHDRAGDVNAVTAGDVVNSELVLLREPDEDDPHSGYEIARGDELTCWHQLELSLRHDRTERKPASIDVRIPQEGVGAWFVNGARYVWALDTLKPSEFVPGHISRQLSISDCERLLRRYRLARRIHDGGFRYHDMTKHVDYLGEVPETWRINLHRLLHILNEAGLTWEGYIEKFGSEPLPMKADLPVGFVMQMLKDLEVEEPNKVFAWPTLAEMAPVTDDKLLSSLLPRVDVVRYVTPQDLDAQTAANLHEAVNEFASGLQMQKMAAAGGLPLENELPYLVYANDAQEFRMSAQALGMRLYVAVSPHLISTKNLLPEVQGVKMWPWAFAHALLVRYERKGAAQ